VVTDTVDEKVKPVLAAAQAAHFAAEHVRVVDYNIGSTGFEGEKNSAEKIALKIPGQHNIQNAKAAFAVARELGIPEEKALTALANFSGTWRRFEDKGETKNGVLVYDDYAHHPSEIAATLQAAREKFPQFNAEKSQQEGRRLVVAFQPHLYSRTKEHFEEFADAFALADEVLLLPIYAAREPADPTVSSEMLAQKIPHNKAKYVENFAAVDEYVKKNLKKGDIFFTMGAGDITKLSDIVLN
jgi:UDP-N-acetylmuramate--alanine ligase